MSKQKLKPPADYKATMFDREGPDAGLRLRAYAYGTLVFGVTITGTFLAVAQGGRAAIAPAMIVGIVCVALLAGLLVSYGALGMSHAAGSGYRAVMINGASTPYREQYSYQQSLVMQGRIDDALASFEALIAENPALVEVRVKAAELYARDKNNPVRAAELFREIRQIPTRSTGDDVYATNRLIDLLTGPLNDPGRALVELRRLIETYPGTSAAAHARNAIASLKPAHIPLH